MTVSIKNSTNTALDNNQTWTGELEDVSKYESVSVNYVSDTHGILTFQFSTDGNSYQDYNIDVLNEYVDNVPIVSKYLRMKFENNSGDNQSYMRLQTLYKSTLSDVQVSGTVTVVTGNAPIQVEEILQSVAVNNYSRPFEFIPTAFNSTSEIYADGEQPYITPYGTWNFTNTNPNKINWYVYRTLKQTDYSLSSILNGYMVIENKSGSTKYPYIAIYSLPDGYDDAEAWYKSKWVYENTNEPLNTDEKVLLWFGAEIPINNEPGIRHIQMPLNNTASAGPRNPAEQLMFITVQTASGEDTGTYNFDFQKLGINWYSFEDYASGAKRQGVMIQNDLSELVVSVSPSPSNALKPYRNLDTNLTASLIKLGPTWLHTINVSNDDNQHLFLKLYSSSTAPNELSVPVWTVRVHTNQSNDINFNGVPLYSELGFWVRCSTGVLDDDIGAPSANGCICNVAYC